MSSELMDASNAGGLFVPCPNMRLASQLVGIGYNRDRFICSPAPSDGPRLARFEFVGRLLGIALRGRVVLSLNLPSIFWKPLVGQEVLVSDVRAIDQSSVDSLLQLRDMDRETFEASIFSSFECLLSDGRTQVILGDGGEVTYDRRLEYVEAVLKCWRHQFDEPMRAVSRGLSELVPVEWLQLLPWQELERQVCGESEVDLAVLQRNTLYRGGVKETDPHVQYFWEVLHEMDARERTLFLRFAWGRQRLPPEADLRREPLKIFPMEVDRPDIYHPVAETCFGNLKIPAYSSKAIMREKLRYSIEHTSTIDGDMQDQADRPQLLRRRALGAGDGAHATIEAMVRSLLQVVGGGGS